MDIVQLAGFVTFSALLLGGILWFFNSRKESAQLNRRGERAKAVIAALREDTFSDEAGTRVVYSVVCRYNVEGLSYEKQAQVDERFFKTLQRGQEVVITYLPTNPRVSRFEWKLS
jgi:preprotein translocase subunit YajC